MHDTERQNQNTTTFCRNSDQPGSPVPSSRTKPPPELIQRPPPPPSHRCVLALVCPPYSRGSLRCPVLELPPLPDITQSRESQSCIDASQNQSPRPVYQQSSSFETRNWFQWRQFFHGPGVGGMVSGWLKHSIFIIHFISNLILALIWQEVLVQTQSLGTPGCMCSNTLQGHYRPWCSVISLAVSSINPTWLPTDLLLVIFDWRTLRQVTCLPKIFMCLHWNKGMCFYAVSVWLTKVWFICFDGF